MSGETVVRVDGLSKMYRVYSRPSDMFWEVVTGRPNHKEYWALKDISFTVSKGEVLGIIGKNGAGKSTLLKILTGTLDSTSGVVETKGKISAILELGTGFNPEYTGRENIYMGGMCIGMSREEIDKNLDSIIDFSELRDFIDQPFRTYSSGMKARLTFATAIHIDPEILIIDEALAVGDMKFQRKCYAKFKEFTTRGKSILFVSHSLDTVSSFCTRAIWIERGLIVSEGYPGDVTKQYYKRLFEEQNVDLSQAGMANTVGKTAIKDRDDRKVELANRMKAAINRAEMRQVAMEAFNNPTPQHAPQEMRTGGMEAEIIDYGVMDLAGQRMTILKSRDEYDFFLRVVCYEDLETIVFGLLIRDKRGAEIFGTDTLLLKTHMANPRRGDLMSAHFRVKMALSAGDYFATFSAARSDEYKYDLRFDVFHFKVVDDNILYHASVVNLEPKFYLSLI